MYLHSLKIKGFRRLKNVKVYFGETTFCIGQNNSGKSSLLAAIGLLLSQHPPSLYDFNSKPDDDNQKLIPVTKEIVLEAEFRNVSNEVKSSRGFKGRTFEYTTKDDSSETGIAIKYRKTYNYESIGSNKKPAKIEIRQFRRVLKEHYQNCNTLDDYINKGISNETINELFPEVDKTKKLSKKNLEITKDIDEIWELTKDEEWFENPGGIPTVVAEKLPRFLLIPAESASNEIEGTNKSSLGNVLTTLFQDVRNESDNYRNAQKYLNLLAKELDPTDHESEFGKMMKDLNSLLGNVFPQTSLHATTDLSNPDQVLKPSFNVELSSNIQTPAKYQGTGVVRHAVFGILRYKQLWEEERGDKPKRSLIIGFEEPEIYLHPSAANLMRDSLYNLATLQTQIVATTHSPFLIDLSRKPRQVLNRFQSKENESYCSGFSITDAFINLQSKDKDYVKMILKIDDYVSRVFFTKTVIIIEGDTEEIVIRESLKRLNEEEKKKILTDFEVIKARGKAAIIALSNYFKALSIKFKVIHDLDTGIEGAEKFNKPISEAAGKSNVYPLKDCIEDLLGYKAPSKDKPYKAFKEAQEWGDDFKQIPPELQKVVKWAFDID